MKPTNYKEALDWAFLLLQKADRDPEAAEYVLLERQAWRKTDLVLNERRPMPESVWQQFEQDVAQLKTGLPAQYLLGYAWFADLKLKVNQATLIPRQETEELVSWIGEVYPATASLRILDIGTGSGAIALALKQHFPNSTVVATDISNAALTVAQENATNLQLPVTFYQGDLWQALPASEAKFDVIVSNPPYIATDEKKVMDYSVLNFEPQTALFADHQGLAIYERLAAEVAHYLQPQGNLFMEFGYQQAPAIKTIFQNALPQHQIEIRHDLADWPRMARVY
ncbi:MAG TPA: peptide chain release factor N(5)-glutamine methyltransferase [Lapidilactobacillus dextrinicus]|uniref:Release factor glutamine methyltransferase n=1 Tax=Lapidilactobacillus dextrinicus TaxID=51664 RepID=A0A921B4Z7_9LACO|nr:peptide chain release factor N(5)-glutamine methyltransferase [Lapidilactobacillus dextrinicus]